MSYSVLKKMSAFYNDVVDYKLTLNNYDYNINSLIGHNIILKWNGQVKCFCGKKFKKFYRSGFCYNCYWSLPQASQSIFKPELCTAHLDIEERDLAWEKKFQIAPHYIYLANSSGIKVGITRVSQGITRWIDQGASQVIILAEVPNRRFSGDIEVAIKKYVSDKTNWRKMLSGKPQNLNLVELKNNLSNYIPKDLKKYLVNDNNVIEINYPVDKYPQKIKSVKLTEETNVISGRLNGIKGQYLILDNDRVFNVRSHEGFLVSFEFNKNLTKQSVLF